MKADNTPTTSTDSFTMPVRRPSIIGQNNRIELRALAACAARHVEECHHLRSELAAILPDQERALTYTQYLLDESETRWQVCVDSICGIGSITVSDLIEKATTIIDARIMREAGAETEDAERRLATSIALDLLAWRDGRVRR
jgi:hypothetical protein